MALNSRAFPLGSLKNIVHCSPGFPAAQGRSICLVVQGETGRTRLQIAMCFEMVGNKFTFETKVRLQNKVKAGLPDPVSQAMKLLCCQCQAKVGHWDWVSVNCIVDAGSVVAFDLMAHNLVPKQGVVHPACCASALLAAQLPAVSCTRWKTAAQRVGRSQTGTRHQSKCRTSVREHQPELLHQPDNRQKRQ